VSPALPPLDRLEMNRMLDAKIQRLGLRGSLPGQVPRFSSRTWPKLFGRQYDALGLDKIKQLYDHLDTLVVK
jgi:hypothetical protein